MYSIEIVFKNLTGFLCSGEISVKNFGNFFADAINQIKYEADVLSAKKCVKNCKNLAK